MLPLGFALKAPVPFTLDTAQLMLQPGEATQVNVTFDPHFK